jgi:hypothetical protein
MELFSPLDLGILPIIAQAIMLCIEDTVHNGFQNTAIPYGILVKAQKKVVGMVL